MVIMEPFRLRLKAFTAFEVQVQATVDFPLPFWRFLRFLPFPAGSFVTFIASPALPAKFPAGAALSAR